MPDDDAVSRPACVAVFSALPTVPDSPSVTPLLFVSDVVSDVWLFSADEIVTLRQLKVGYTSIRHADRNDRTIRYSRCPSLNLKGNWLEEAGFSTGAPVTVTVEHGQLIIRPLTE